MAIRKVLSFMVGVVVVMAGLAKAGPLDTRIPQDAIVYVGWQGADDLGKAYDQSNLKNFIEASKLPEFLKENWPKWMDMAKGGDEEKGQEMAEALAGAQLLWRHTTAFYVGPVSFTNPDKPDVKVAILCEAGADAGALEDWVKKLLAKDPPPPDAKVAVQRAGTLVMLTVGDLKPADFSPANGGLANAAGYKTATAGMMKDSAIAAYVDGQKIVNLVHDAVQADRNAPEETRKKVPTVIKTLGLLNLGSIAYTGGLDGKEWREQAFIGARAPRTGVLALADSAPVTDDTLKLIPREAAAFSVGHLDLSKLMAIVREVYKESADEAMPPLDEGLQMFRDNVGVDLEKDILNPLGDEWIFYRGAMTETGSYPIVLVNKLKDPATFTKTLDTLAAKVNDMAQGKVKIEKLDAGTIEVTGVRLPQVGAIAWTIRNGYLYVSNLDGIGPAVEQVEKMGEPILANQTYAKLRASFPNVKPVSIAYAEPAKLYSEFHRTISALLPMARMFGLDLPEGLLPNPKRVAPFLTPGMTLTWVDNDGVHMLGRSAFPGATIMSGQGSPTWGFMGGLAVGIMVPSLARAREQAKVTVTAANLHSIGIACAAYEVEHQKYPDQLAQLAAEKIVSGGRVFVSPRSSTKPMDLTDEKIELSKTDFEKFAREFDQHCDFVYLGKGLKAKDANPNLIMCFEKPVPRGRPGINLLFYDGHVEWTVAKALPEIFKATNEDLKKRGEAEVDVDALVKATNPPATPQH